MGLAASRQEAFWEACGFGNLRIAKELLEAGEIDVNWVSYTNDCCPIHVASQGKPEIVDLLLEHNCDVNVRDNRDNLALHHAAMRGHSDIVKTLIDAGSEINAQEKNGWTPLHNAAYWCQPDVIKVLIKSGCDVNIQNKDQRTALHECARSQDTNNRSLGLIATMLIDAGCDVNAKSSDRGEADLTGLMFAAYHNHPEVASALIAADCHLDDVGSTFWSALHWAADRGHDELVYTLLEAGADPTKKGMRGETALDRAQSESIREIISTAMDLYKELHKASLPIKQAPVAPRPQPVTAYTPKCDANFKSQSFLPKDWKPVSSAVDIKNLINEKKSRLAAMTSQQYRNDLAMSTGARSPIKDNEDTASRESSEDVDGLVNGDVDSVDTNDSKTESDADDEAENSEECKNDDNDINVEPEQVSEASIGAQGDDEEESTSEKESRAIEETQNDSNQIDDCSQKSESAVNIQSVTDSVTNTEEVGQVNEQLDHKNYSVDLTASEVECIRIDEEVRSDCDEIASPVVNETEQEHDQDSKGESDKEKSLSEPSE